MVKIKIAHIKGTEWINREIEKEREKKMCLAINRLKTQSICSVQMASMTEYTNSLKTKKNIKQKQSARYCHIDKHKNMYCRQ